MTDLMSQIAKFYRIETVACVAGFKGVVIHKGSRKRLVVNAECPTESAAVAVARAHLTGAVKRGAVPLA